VLILRDVLAMPAAEIASLLEMTIASVNGAPASSRPAHGGIAVSGRHRPGPPSDTESSDLLERYMAAFTAMDVEALKGTLREDALLQMPPFPEWFPGRDAIGEFLATDFARGGSWRFAQTRANGQLALGVYPPAGQQRVPVPPGAGPDRDRDRHRADRRLPRERAFCAVRPARGGCGLALRCQL